MPRLATTLYGFLTHRRTRYWIAWLVAFIAATSVELIAWNALNVPTRRDGNWGHASIDFGGQWLMGRMIYLGLGHHLYHRQYQREVLLAAYPREDEVPDEERDPEDKGKHDAEMLMQWFMGKDDPALEAAGLPQVGGALYPPIHAVLMAPLGSLSPRTAYRSMQLAALLAAPLAGWGIVLLSKGRIWWPVATAALFIFPGFVHNLNLGQNGTWTMILTILGWALIAGNRPIAGGILWGLLAYKPVWAAAFLLVPLWTARWRVALAMILSAATMIAATLPLVGWHAWLDWLQVGRYASRIYQTDENWIFLSRDLITIPRRWFMDFHTPDASQDLAATLLGAAFLLAAIECTTRTAVFRKDRSSVLTGPPAAFLFLGAWLACFHFMYYDVMLAALPVLLLLLQPEEFVRPRFLAVAPLDGAELPDSLRHYFRPGLAGGAPSGRFSLLLGYRGLYVVNSMILSLIFLFLMSVYAIRAVPVDVSVSLPLRGIPMPMKYSTVLAGTPLDTFCLIALWLWCGWLWMQMPVGERTEKCE